MFFFNGCDDLNSKWSILSLRTTRKVACNIKITDLKISENIMAARKENEVNFPLEGLIHK